MLGVVYHAQGRFQDAEGAFETALRLNPRYTEAALNLSVTYNDRGKYDLAREVYRRAVTASASQPGSLDQFARGKLADMHADLGAARRPVPDRSCACLPGSYPDLATNPDLATKRRVRVF
jgi:tetratricopeptide (TPR) repeat protein